MISGRGSSCGAQTSTQAQSLAIALSALPAQPHGTIYQPTWAAAITWTAFENTFAFINLAITVMFSSGIVRGNMYRMLEITTWCGWLLDVTIQCDWWIELHVYLYSRYILQMKDRGSNIDWYHSSERVDSSWNLNIRPIAHRDRTFFNGNQL